MTDLTKLNFNIRIGKIDHADDNTIISYHLEGGVIQTLDGDIHFLKRHLRGKVKDLIRSILLNPDNYKKKNN